MREAERKKKTLDEGKREDGKEGDAGEVKEK